MFNILFLQVAPQMKDNTTIDFNGFLQLPNLEKLDLVNAINEFFDSS